MTADAAAHAEVLLDNNIAPRRDVPLWSETRWNGCWNPDHGVGVYLHAGRYRHDLDLWWAQIVTYLPGRRLTVDRRWGRNTSDAGISLQDFELSMTPSGWTCSYDSVAQLTTIDELAEDVRGSSAPVAAVKFDVKATGRQHQWDMYAGRDIRLDFAGEMHIQQGFTTTGTLVVGDERYRLDGVGFKDHSAGTRDFAGWYRHRYMMWVADSWTAHMVSMAPRDGNAATIGVVIREGIETPVTRFDLPPVTDSAGGPVHGDATIELATGELLQFRSELVHALPMTVTDDNDNINGVDWRRRDDPIVLIEGIGRLTAPDGAVVHGFHERSARRSLVKPPSPEPRSSG